MIGIMADSHGDPETILAALNLFQGMDCRRIYHLGDVCDSTRPKTVEACLRPLQKHRVITIKGNNDHTIVANHIGRKDAPIAPEILKYIQHLISVTGSDAESLLAYFGFESLESIPRNYASRVISALETKKRAA